MDSEAYAVVTEIKGPSPPYTTRMDSSPRGLCPESVEEAIREATHQKKPGWTFVVTDPG